MKKTNESIKQEKGTHNIQSPDYQLLLQHFASAILQNNIEGDNLHITGSARKVSEPVRGTSKMNVYGIVPEVFKMELPGANPKAKHNSLSVKFHNLNVGSMERNSEIISQPSNRNPAICKKEFRSSEMFNKAFGFKINKAFCKLPNEIAFNNRTDALMKFKNQGLDPENPAHTITLFPGKDKTLLFQILAQPTRYKQVDFLGVSTCASECLCEKPLTNTMES